MFVERKLSDLCYGERAAVVKITDEDLSGQLMELGCFEGALISLEHAGPFGDPLIVSFSGSRFALRRSEASQIIVS